MNITELASAIQSTSIYDQNSEAFLRMLGVPEDAIERMDPNRYRPIISLLYVSIGAANEAGEALGTIKKLLRGDHDYATAKERFAKENRDVLWYVFEGMRVAGEGAEIEVEALLKKLAERKEKGTIKGDGESNEDRVERAMLLFLQQVQRRGRVSPSEVNIPGNVLKALVDARYLVPSLNGVVITVKGENAVRQGVLQKIIDE